MNIKSLLWFAVKVWLAVFAFSVIGSLVGKVNAPAGNLIADPSSAGGMLGL